MTNTAPQTSSYYAQPPVAAPVATGAALATQPTPAPGNGIEHMKKRTKYLLAGLLMFVLIIGGGAAMYLMTTQQDTRQQASVEGCIGVPTARGEAVTRPSDTQFKLQWNAVPEADGYRIVLITEGQAGSHPNNGLYVIYNVLDNNANVGQTAQFAPTFADGATSLPPTQTDYTWNIPQDEQLDREGLVVKDRPYYRFLVYAYKGTGCSSQAAIGMYTAVAQATATPTATVTPTGQPTAQCAPIKLTNTRTEWINDYSQIKIDWQLTEGEVSEYEIWNIGYGTEETLGKDNYYLVNLTQGSPLPASATSYVVENPNELKTRRFLIRGIKTRNAAGQPACYSQAALCRPPVITDRKVVQTSDTSYQFTWTPIQKPDERYEIWMIGVGTLEELGEEGYYLKLLEKNVDRNATSHTVVLDSAAQAINTNRFLIRYINYTFDGAPQCYDQGALSVSGTGGTTPPPAQTDACTIKFTVTAPSTTPTPTSPPGATATPTATPTSAPAVTPVIGCNQLCVTNADCTNSAHICWTVSDTESRCRLDSNPDDDQCRPVATESQPTTAQQQPVLPETLPETGPENWGNWLKAGLAILGVGAALLLML